MWKRFAAGLLDLLAPPACAACRAPLLVRTEGFCDPCRSLIEPAPYAKDDPHRDAVIYGGPIRDALHRFKYEGASELAGALGRLLEAPADSLLGRIDMVTAVPLHPRRLRERGYNQALLLAARLSSSLSVPLSRRLLVRTRDTDAQVGRNLGRRAAQLQGAFVAARSAHAQRILVVDDVRTTGATLLACVRALSEAGAAEVYTLALAGALMDDDLELS